MLLSQIFRRLVCSAKQMREKRKKFMTENIVAEDLRLVRISISSQKTMRDKNCAIFRLGNTESALGKELSSACFLIIQ